MRPIVGVYRVQFGGEVTFDRAAALAPYLERLGVTHLYASPVFEAAPGSTHGYDVTDYNALRAELGGREGFGRMVRALHERGLGLVLDIVPNHMAASPHNPWLADVMRRGRRSEHAGTFDVDWDKSGGKLVLPVLGAPLDEVLEKGELQIVTDDALGPCVAYYDARFPLAGGTEGGDGREVLERQHFALSYWRDLERLNYRRFFDITDLIGVRMEDEAVFERSHRLVRELIEEGAVDGLRIDHVDGMRDPEGYLRRLAGFFPDQDPPPVWVEKIVEGDERVPASWPVRGETGYAAMPWLDGVLTNREAEAPFTALYAELANDTRQFREVEHEAKREVVDGPFAHEFETLSAQVADALGEDEAAVRGVIEAVAIAFPVYRTYLPGEGEEERLRAFARAAKEGHDEALFGHVLDLLADPAQPAALSFQQMTGPVTAKAVEDTSFYRWHRWSALNEVGGDPSVFGRSVEAFHEEMQARAKLCPQALTATATHDTKRGEDVRARLAAATHVPEAWQGWARRWFDASARLRTPVADNTAYLLFQTAVGFWPVNGEDEKAGLGDRLVQYALKAARERKRDTSWTDQNETYEQKLERLARATCEGELAGIVRETAEALAGPAADLSLARLVLKMTVPGVPDTYNGTEATSLSLVDPDNRRPVDWDALGALIESGEGPSGRKAKATATLLRLRREAPGLFLHSAYEPREAPEGVLAFARRHEGKALAVAVAVRPGAALPEAAEPVVLEDRAARVAWA
jgi:(1->4)-alpha-D-glucan 1-alpha-D-glucosylmutase